MVLFHLRSRQVRLLRDADDTRDYDGFVVYARGDLPWVVDHMIPEIEERRGYSLCLEDRDWLAGKPIVDNIIESLENSHKVILVISPHFTAAPWCEELLMIAQSHLAGKARNALIAVVLEEPKVEQMIASLRALLTTHSCLYWPHNPRQEKRFWKALNSAIKKHVKRVAEPDTTTHVNRPV